MTVRRTAREIGEQCLAMRVRRLGRGVTRIYDEELRPLGINVAQLNLLVALGATGGLRAADLSLALDIEKSTLSRNLARLQDQGLVQSGDELRLTLSDAGEQLLGKARPAWRRAQGRAEELLGPSLARALSAIPAQ